MKLPELPKPQKIIPTKITNCTVSSLHYYKQPHKNSCNYLTVVVQQIKDTAAQVEKLAPQVTSAALSARHNPRDRQAHQHLTLVKDEWAAKVKQLTAVVDDVTDAQELLTASGLF